MKRVSLMMLVVLLCSWFVFTSPGETNFFENTKTKADKYELKYNMAGQKKFILNLTSESKEIMMGSETAQNEKSSIDMKVVSSKNGKMTMELEYKALSTETSGVSAVDYSGLIGKKVSFVLSENGVTDEFRGFDKLPVLQMNDGNTIKSENYVRSIRNLFPKLSAKPVEVGDSWTYTGSEETPVPGGKMLDSTEYSLTVLEKVNKGKYECLKIETRLKKKIIGNGTFSGFEYTYEGKGEGTEIMYFAIEEGMYLEIDGTVRVEGAAAVGANQIPITDESKYKYEVRFDN